MHEDFDYVGELHLEDTSLRGNGSRGPLRNGCQQPRTKRRAAQSKRGAGNDTDSVASGIPDVLLTQDDFDVFDDYFAVRHEDTEGSQQLVPQEDVVIESPLSDELAVVGHFSDIDEQFSFEPGHEAITELAVHGKVTEESSTDESGKEKRHNEGSNCEGGGDLGEGSCLSSTSGIDDLVAEFENFDSVGAPFEVEPDNEVAAPKLKRNARKRAPKPKKKRTFLTVKDEIEFAEGVDPEGLLAAAKKSLWEDEACSDIYGLKDVDLSKILAAHENADADTDNWCNRCLKRFPFGASIWRESILGEALQSVLSDIEGNALSSSSQPGWPPPQSVPVDKIMSAFEAVMTKSLRTFCGKTQLRILSGEIKQYKCIEGTWVLYLSNLKSVMMFLLIGSLFSGLSVLSINVTSSKWLLKRVKLT